MMNQYPKQKADYYLESFDDELLLFHPSDKKIYQLNATAALVWQLCNGKHTVDEITMLLLDAYPNAGEVLVHEADMTIQQLLSQGVIEFV